VVAGLLRDIFGKEQACTSGRVIREDGGEDAAKVRLCVRGGPLSMFTVDPCRAGGLWVNDILLEF
jgi:hypothetical protein